METLNMRLVRRGVAIAATLKQRFLPGGAEALAEANWTPVEGATVYYGQIFSNSPKWLNFLKAGVNPVDDAMLSSGAGAVIFVPASGRYYAICFGHIHIALDDDAFERQFGLKVVLNSVLRGNLRTLDLATPDAVTFQKRIQASRDSDLREFGVDMLRDLARVAGGTPTEKSFAKFVAGKDALSITCDVNSSTIKDKCEEVGNIFRKKAYQNDFSWIDNLKVVDESGIIQSLDARLFKALEDIRKGKPSDLHMTPPEIVDYMDGSDLHYNGFGSYGSTFSDLSILDYANELNRLKFNGPIADIKSKHKVSARGSDGGGFKEKWKVYECFIFECSLGSGKSLRHYVLFSGEWYLVSKNFKDKVEKFFSSVDKVKIIGPTKCLNERELISDIEANRNDLYKLDQVKINPSGTSHAFIEPCDFISLSGAFIHLKDGHSSGPISHLWAQGVVSAESLISDPDFREKLRKKIIKSNFKSIIPTKSARIDRSKLKVVYGVMRKRLSSGTLDIPFFSKVSFQSNAEKLQKLGVDIAIEIIEKL